MNNERIDIDEQFALVNTLFDQAETKFQWLQQDYGYSKFYRREKEKV